MLITSFGDGVGSKLNAVKQLPFEITVNRVLPRRQLSSCPPPNTARRWVRNGSGTSQTRGVISSEPGFAWLSANECFRQLRFKCERGDSQSWLRRTFRQARLNSHHICLAWGPRVVAIESIVRRMPPVKNHSFVWNHSCPIPGSRVCT